MTEFVNSGESIGPDGSTVEEELSIPTLNWRDFDFSRLSIEAIRKGQLSTCRVNYDYGNDVWGPLIMQFPPLPSFYGLSKFQDKKTGDISWSIAYDLVGDEAKEFLQMWTEKLDKPLLQMGTGPKRREWFPKFTNKDAAANIRQNFDSNIKTDKVPKQFKAKIDYDPQEGFAVGGWLNDPEKKASSKIAQMYFETFFRKGLYYNTHRLTCVYFGGKSWGLAWKVVDISKIKGGSVPNRPRQTFGNKERPTFLLGSDYKVDSTYYEPSAEELAEASGKRGDEEDGGGDAN